MDVYLARREVRAALKATGVQLQRIGRLLRVSASPAAFRGMYIICVYYVGLGVELVHMILH